MTATELERASAPHRALAHAVDEGKLSMHGILQAMGINASDPLFQAMLLICDKYGLDPMLGHVEVLPRSKKPYITRDGFLHIAHMSGQLDGIETTPAEDKTDTAYWQSTCSVWRKDMGRPFVYTGRYPKAGSNKQYAKEMAVKTAERTALKRAFNVSEPSDDGHDPGQRTAELDELAHSIESEIATREWVAEHGDPAALEAGDLVEADTLDLDGAA